MIDVLTSSTQRRLTTAARLRDALADRLRHPHRSLITEVVTEVAEGVHLRSSAGTSATSSARTGCPAASGIGSSTVLPATIPRCAVPTLVHRGGTGRPIRTRSTRLSGICAGTIDWSWPVTQCSATAGETWSAGPAQWPRRWPRFCRLAAGRTHLGPAATVVCSAKPLEPESIGRKVRPVALFFRRGEIPDAGPRSPDARCSHRRLDDVSEACRANHQHSRRRLARGGRAREAATSEAPT